MPFDLSGRIIAVSVVLATASSGCSSPSPTRPSEMPRASRGAPSAAAPGSDVCAAYNGSARGLCHALFAIGCDVNGPTPQACDRMIDTFRNVTGQSPTFLFRDYVSRDVNVCSQIAFLCAEGYRAFFDDSGCGCERIP